jgi:transposase
VRDALGSLGWQALSAEMWARVEPVLPPVKGAMGQPMREQGRWWRKRSTGTGSAWRDLLAEFGPWHG